MWSPKRNVNGDHIRPYDLMRSIQPGDVVFSYADGQIKAVGIARTYCYEFPKPIDFGNAGSNWSDIGWRVDVNYTQLHTPIKPKDSIDLLRPLLPSIHSPIQANGDGNQAYLFDISESMSFALAALMERWVLDLLNNNYISEPDLLEDGSVLNVKHWEDVIEREISEDDTINETERLSLIKSRIGQGRYRSGLLAIEKQCRVTSVGVPDHLIASHTKPWRSCSNEERLDPENGFMLTPTIDHLFDKGFITFENTGRLVVSSVAHNASINKMGIDTSTTINVGSFTEGQRKYLEYHQELIFLS